MRDINKKDEDKPDLPAGDDEGHVDGNQWEGTPTETGRGLGRDAGDDRPVQPDWTGGQADSSSSRLTRLKELGEYRILKVSAEMMGMPALAQGKIPAMDLVDPEVDFVGLAHAFGVEAHRISAPDELTDRVRDALHGSEPVLLDVPIEG